MGWLFSRSTKVEVSMIKHEYKIKDTPNHREQLERMSVKFTISLVDYCLYVKVTSQVKKAIDQATKIYI